MRNLTVKLVLLTAICYLCNFSIVNSKTLKKLPKHMHPPPTQFDQSSRVKRDEHRVHNDGYESTSHYWRMEAQKKLRCQLDKKDNNNIAKNVIFFLGDGMSVSTITAARIYYGQKMGYSGEESTLSFEEFPHIGLSKVRVVEDFYFILNKINKVLLFSPPDLLFR